MISSQNNTFLNINQYFTLAVWSQKSNHSNKLRLVFGKKLPKKYFFVFCQKIKI